MTLLPFCRATRSNWEWSFPRWSTTSYLPDGSHCLDFVSAIANDLGAPILDEFREDIENSSQMTPLRAAVSLTKAPPDKRSIEFKTLDRPRLHHLPCGHLLTSPVDLQICLYSIFNAWLKTKQNTLPSSSSQTQVYPHNKCRQVPHICCMGLLCQRWALWPAEPVPLWVWRTCPGTAHHRSPIAWLHQGIIQSTLGSRGLRNFMGPCLASTSSTTTSWCCSLHAHRQPSSTIWCWWLLATSRTL